MVTRHSPGPVHDPAHLCRFRHEGDVFSMSTRQTLPVLPLRGTVIFPGLTAPIAAGRPGTLRAIEAALKGDRLVFAVAQRDNSEEPTSDILYSMGVVARIGQVQRGLGGVRLPDLAVPLGTHTVQNQPLSRACMLLGGYVPFAKTKAEREAAARARHFRPALDRIGAHHRAQHVQRRHMDAGTRCVNGAFVRLPPALHRARPMRLPDHPNARSPCPPR